MLAILSYFIASVVIPETANLLISVSNAATVTFIFIWSFITFFTIVGLKVHADMNSTVVGSMVLGIRHCCKIIYISIFNIFSNIVTRSIIFFKNHTKSSLISYFFVTALLIIII